MLHFNSVLPYEEKLINIADYIMKGMDGDITLSSEDPNERAIRISWKNDSKFFDKKVSLEELARIEDPRIIAMQFVEDYHKSLENQK